MQIFFHRRKDSLPALVRYVLDPEKTAGGQLVSAVGCSAERSAEEMEEVRRYYQKERGAKAYHVILNFLPGEATPELAHFIGNRLAEKLFPDCQYVVATHSDKDHIHDHFVVGKVSDRDGSCFQMPFFSRRKFREEVWAVLEEAGLPVSEKERDPNRLPEKNYADSVLHHEGCLTIPELVRQDVRESIAASADIQSFYTLMEAKGYLVDRYRGYPLFIPSGSGKGCRAWQDGKPMTEQDLAVAVERSVNDPRVDLPRLRVLELYRPPEDLEGLNLLYDTWMHVVREIGREGIHLPDIPVDFYEVRRIRFYRRQQEYLAQNGISAERQLESRIAEIGAREERLRGEWESLVRVKWGEKFKALSRMDRYRPAAEGFAEGKIWLRKEAGLYEKAAARVASKGGEDRVRSEWEELRNRCRELTVERRACRKEKRLCEQILKEAPVILDRMEQVLDYWDRQREAVERECAGQADAERERPEREERTLSGQERMEFRSLQPEPRKRKEREEYSEPERG